MANFWVMMNRCLVCPSCTLSLDFGAVSDSSRWAFRGNPGSDQYRQEAIMEPRRKSVGSMFHLTALCHRGPLAMNHSRGHSAFSQMYSPRLRGIYVEISNSCSINISPLLHPRPPSPFISYPPCFLLADPSIWTLPILPARL